MCKVKYSELNIIRTMGNMRRINYSDKNTLIDYLVDRLGILTDNYQDNRIDEIIFTYIIKEELANEDRLLIKDVEHQSSNFNYNHMKLPLSMNPKDYGKILSTTNLPFDSKINENGSRITSSVKYIVENDKHQIFVIWSKPILHSDFKGKVGAKETVNTVELKGAAQVTWFDSHVDIFDNASGSYFRRVIGKTTTYIQDGKTIVKSKQLPAKPFSKVKADKKMSLNETIMTMDIETVLNEDKVMKPYLISGYSEGKFIDSYATNLTDVGISEMMNDFITQILKNTSKVKYIYAHNFGSFDGVLLLKYLLNYPGGKVAPIIHNGKLISVSFRCNVEGKIRSLVFKDSYLMIPGPLRELCKSFNVTTPPDS